MKVTDSFQAWFYKEQLAAGRKAVSGAQHTKAATRCQGPGRCCSRRISYQLEHWPCESSRACYAQEGEKGKLENSSNIKLLLTPSLPLDHPLFLVAVTHLPLLNCHLSSQRTRHSHWLQTEPLFTKHTGNAFNSRNSSLYSSVWSLPGGKQSRGVCSLWAWSSQLCRQFRKGSDVCPASPLGEQSDGWKRSSKIRGRKKMQGKGKHCHSLGLCMHRCVCVYVCACVCVCVFPFLPLPFHLIS